jgi:REP element-mobilizing transposase RayT
MLYQVIEEAHTRYKFELWDIAIDDSYFTCHIKPEPGQSLSRILQWIKSVVARRWNKVRGIHGHLWGARFYSEIFEEEKLVEEVIREVQSEFTQRQASFLSLPLPELVSYHPRN